MSRRTASAGGPQTSKIAILDFGSQYTQVIARRVRECRVYSEILPHDTTAEALRKNGVQGIIFSGGPASVYAKGAPRVDRDIYKLGLPILGICYGMQLLARDLGGAVEPSKRREFGPGKLSVTRAGRLFAGMPRKLEVWNSHGDKVTKLPRGFVAIGTTENSQAAAVADLKRGFYGLQFHPEVSHTPRGSEVIENFLLGVCGCRPDWTPGVFIEQACAQIREQVGEDRVVLGLSGGVD
ncbi:MAG: glutamine-hydrolyzing GMP synthase, partial [Chthoniobacterales bacterium]